MGTFIVLALFRGIQNLLEENLPAKFKRKILWIVVAVIAFIAASWSIFTYYAEYQASVLTLNTGVRVVIGGDEGLTPFTRQWLNSHPGKSVQDLLPDAENKVEAVWLIESIDDAELRLIWKYFIAFLFVAVVIGGAVEVNMGIKDDDGNGGKKNEVAPDDTVTGELGEEPSS